MGEPPGKEFGISAESLSRCGFILLFVSQVELAFLFYFNFGWGNGAGMALANFSFEFFFLCVFA